jgi:hypothetical protein
MPKTSPRDYSKIKAGSLTIGNEGKPRPVSRGGINPKTGEYVRRGSLTQKPRGTFLENVKTPKGEMYSGKTGKVIEGSKSPYPKEMLSDRQIKAIKGKKPGVLTKIKAKLYALQGKTPKGNPTRNIYPLFKTDSTKGKIPKTRQVRPRTISPLDGKPIRPSSGGGLGTRGGTRGGRYSGSGGGLKIGGRKGFGEQ